MWDVLCQHVMKKHVLDYQALCADLGIYASEGLPCMTLQDLYTSKIGYKKIRRTVEQHAIFMNNVFLHPALKEWIQRLYCTCKRHYLAIQRCIVRSVYRRRKSCNMFDLSYTPFTEYTPSLCLFIMDNGKKYTFTHSDLYNIIEKSLTNADTYMIANPLPIKNPYTGTCFSNEQLYFLYLNLKHLPLVFRHFISNHFDIQAFLLDNECILRQYQIRKRIQDIPRESLKQEMQDMVIEMCLYLTFTMNVETHLITITQNERECRQMLTHYYNYLYSLNPYQRQCECKTLLGKLRKMYVKPI